MQDNPIPCRRNIEAPSQVPKVFSEYRHLQNILKNRLLKEDRHLPIGRGWVFLCNGNPLILQDWFSILCFCKPGYRRADSFRYPSSSRSLYGKRKIEWFFFGVNSQGNVSTTVIRIIYSPNGTPFIIPRTFGVRNMSIYLPPRFLLPKIRLSLFFIPPKKRVLSGSLVIWNADFYLSKRYAISPRLRNRLGSIAGSSSVNIVPHLLFHKCCIPWMDLDGADLLEQKKREKR